MSIEYGPDLSVLLDAQRLAKRQEWERDRARNRRTGPPSDTGDTSYEPIEFPDRDGLRHAAMVVIGAHIDRPDGRAEIDEVMAALAIPQIYREGGDGRTVKVQRGKVRFGDEQDPAAFSVEEADRRPEKKRGRRRA